MGGGAPSPRRTRRGKGFAAWARPADGAGSSAVGKLADSVPAAGAGASPGPRFSSAGPATRPARLREPRAGEPLCEARGADPAAGAPGSAAEVPDGVIT